MEIPFALIQFGGSLIAIFALAGLAAWLGLGRKPKLAGEADAQRWAGEVHDGYASIRVAVDAEGRGAILEDASGQLMVLRPHGGHFAGRLLSTDARAESDDGKIIVDCAEPQFGVLNFKIADPAIWAQRINALERPGDA